MKNAVFVKRAAIVIATAFCLTANTSVNADFMTVDNKPEQRPSFQSRKDIPNVYKWNLEPIYASKKAWETDAKQVEDMARAFERHQGKLASSESALLSALNDFSAMMRLLDKVNVYAHLSLDVDLSNADQQAMADRAEKVTTLVNEKTAWFIPELLAIPDQSMNTYLQAKALEPYVPFIKDNLRTKEHILPKDQEKLLAQLSPLAGAPGNVYEMLSKDITFPTIRDENGKEVQLTQANFVSYMESKQPQVRKAAFEAYYQTLEKFQDTFAQSLAAHVKTNNFFAKARRFPTAREASLTSNNVPVKVYDELVETVNKNLPLLHRYMATKKKLLGVKELHMYDLYTPIVAAESRYIPYSEAKQMVLNGLSPLGDEYCSVLAKAFADRWIDVYSTKGKRSGAYQTGAYDTHPYVLLNYQGTSDDVSTIAHELGHAMQSYYTNKKQPYITANYPIFTAEVASTLNETLLFKNRYANARTKHEKLALLNQYLEHFRTTLFRQAQFAEFEKQIHEKEQAGEALTAEMLKKLYQDINEKYYGKGVVSDGEIAMEWARIPHFYYTFYVYQYATSFAAAQALAKQIMDDGKPAVERIRGSLLSDGSSKEPIEVLKHAGVDMSTSKPVEEALQLFAEALDELEKLADDKT